MILAFKFRNFLPFKHDSYFLSVAFVRSLNYEEDFTRSHAYHVQLQYICAVGTGQNQQRCLVQLHAGLSGFERQPFQSHPHR